jgi:hypothetical protein
VFLVTRRAVSDIWRTEASCLASGSGGVETIVEKRALALHTSAPSPSAGSHGLPGTSYPVWAGHRVSKLATRTRSGDGPIRRKNCLCPWS